MDYHSDRFADHSLMAYRKGRLWALLPANTENGTLYSHQGLTYGGWVLPPEGLDTTEIFLMWRRWLEYCSCQTLERIVYKPLPYIYALRPSQEDLYMLFLSGAEIIRTDISSTIDLSHNPGFNKLQKRHLKKNWNRVVVKTNDACDIKKIREYHKMLSDCLASRHATRPVHTVSELERLATLFPENIKLWTVSENSGEEMQAGIMVYENPDCVHCQYIATTDEGRKNDLLAPLVAKMIEHYTEEGKRYFDFGISNENGGRALNPGLNRQKTSYGGSGVAYQQFRLNVASALESLPTELWPTR